jgi:hypothetical protein
MMLANVQTLQLTAINTQNAILKQPGTEMLQWYVLRGVRVGI